jgi:hypothetical protein
MSNTHTHCPGFPELSTSPTFTPKKLTPLTLCTKFVNVTEEAGILANGLSGLVKTAFATKYRHAFWEA